jgi:hypothetical protein
MLRSDNIFKSYQQNTKPYYTVMDTLLTSSTIKESHRATVSDVKDESVERKLFRQIDSSVEFRSVLRIRPLTDDEDGETEVFSLPENDPYTVHLLKPEQQNISSHQRNTPNNEKRLAFSFDQVIDSKCSQERMYDEIGGADMAWEAVEPIISQASHQSIDTVNNHVVMSLGVSNSGKTYSTFGRDDQNEQDEGMVPRIIDDIFASRQDPAMKTALHKITGLKEAHMKLKINMVHVHNDRIYDMLSTDEESRTNTKTSNVSKTIEMFENTSRANTDSSGSSKPLRELKITRDKHTMDFTVNANTLICDNADEARKVLKVAQKNNTVSSTRMNKKSSRGHTIITLRPVMMGLNEVIFSGSSITILDMAGIERTKGNTISSGMNLRESAAINSTISAVLQCLRTIKSNQNGVDNEENLTPGSSSVANNINMSLFRQNTLLMLLQPLLSGSPHTNLNARKNVTTVKLFVSVYPGMKDYYEKKKLLTDIHSLRGMSFNNTIVRCAVSEDDINIENPSGKGMKETTRDRQSTPLALAKLAKRKRINTPSKVDSTPLQERKEVSISSSSKKQKSSEHMRIESLIEKISELENQNSTLKTKYDMMKKKCIALQQENREFQNMLDESSAERERRTLSKVQTALPTKEEDKHFLQYRNFRRKEQTLLQPEITNHVEKVELTRCLASGKIGRHQTISPFKLSALYRNTTSLEDDALTEKDDDERPSLETSDTFESTHSA